MVVHRDLMMLEMVLAEGWKGMVKGRIGWVSIGVWLGDSSCLWLRCVTRLKVSVMMESL